MLRVTIIAVGKLHEPWKSLATQYSKQLKPFAKIESIEVKDVRFTSAHDRDRVLAKETENILAAVSEHSHLIALSEHGKEYSTPAFAAMLKKIESEGAHLTFAIGGPLGIGQTVLKKSKAVLSLSPMTFTHEMARVILLEQLYRGLTIINNKTYHY